MYCPGVDLSRFRPMSQRYSGITWIWPEKNILFVGRPLPLKGIDNLFRAVASLENLKSITLSVVGGDGNSQEKSRLEAWAENAIKSNGSFSWSDPSRRIPIHYNAAECAYYLLITRVLVWLPGGCCLR
ncbi:MAG: hypothetical protein Ct9H300mP19_17900 [Dehalococcoidia bacterium]|nr:MAG: hypothetical protein Ct9H300mP19_17900 [Dehalococcoidia bacterium]